MCNLQCDSGLLSHLGSESLHNPIKKTAPVLLPLEVKMPNMNAEKYQLVLMMFTTAFAVCTVAIDGARNAMSLVASDESAGLNPNKVSNQL